MRKHNIGYPKKTARFLINNRSGIFLVRNLCDFTPKTRGMIVIHIEFFVNDSRRPQSIDFPIYHPQSFDTGTRFKMGGG